MEVVVLASGSKGNSTFIKYKNTKILIDAGIPAVHITRKLEALNEDPNELDAILITHTHVDHVKGLRVFLKKRQIPVYITPKMEPEIDIANPNFVYIRQSQLKIKDLTIEVIKTSHDVVDSVGYVVNSEEAGVVYITDTGYINKKYYPVLENKDAYIMESNHDVTMLLEGSYPYHLKQRILNDTGHLSNKDSAKHLSKLVGNKTKYVVLAHLSEENNTPEKALETLNETLNHVEKQVDHIMVATQENGTGLIEV